MFRVAYQPKALDLHVWNKHAAARTKETAFARPNRLLSYRSRAPRLLAVNLRNGHSPGRMRQAKLEFTDLNLVPYAELRSRQTRQVALCREDLRGWETKHLRKPV